MKSAVITTVYKRYNYINQALNSLLNQTSPPDQVIITTDNIELIKNIPLIKELQNLNIIKADYASIGKKIATAIDNLNDDIDIVFFFRR
ncbi:MULTISPECIES: glycosyltransferase family 2 protein [Saccharolobus]|uniref:glycosyltransferase family 2 protein n=1 Tax=Saccharolobus TaxID=2100760 RepID=UPI001F0E5249|nr:glycosyltransferase family 2 protein [Saccharolobus shibatae]MCH4816764.1 glycosyltransferase family 2 protein [Saccharolobus shibatae]